MLIEVLDIFERYGMHHRDDQHTGCATGLIKNAALIYDAQQPSWRAVVGPALVEQQTELLAEMCRDAVALVGADLDTCQECDRFDGDMCSRHASALARADAYRSLGRYLGAHVM